MKVPEWIKKLLKILGIEVKFPDKISPKIELVVKIGSENKTITTGDITVIQIGQDSKEVKEILKEEIIRQVEDNIPLLESSARNDVEETSKAVNLTKQDEELLEYYKEKLPYELHEILKLSLIHRNMRKQHLDANGFKLRIMREYPIYGRNMTNLVN